MNLNTKETLFQSLRNEIVNSISIENNYIIAMYTISITIMGFAINENNEWFFLLPFLILFPFQSTLNAKRNGMIKIATYIEVFLEPYNHWELFTYKFGQKKPNTKRSHKFISRTESVQIGVVCTFGGCLCHALKLTDIASVAVTDFAYFVFSVIPLIIIIYLNNNVWKVNSLHQDYKAIMEELKKAEKS